MARVRTTGDQPWTTGQAVGFLAMMAGVCMVAYGISEWPIHSEWGWWPWVVCTDWAAGSPLCAEGSEEGVRAAVVVASGAVVSISGLIVVGRTATPSAGRRPRSRSGESGGD